MKKIFKKQAEKDTTIKLHIESKVFQNYLYRVPSQEQLTFSHYTLKPTSNQFPKPVLVSLKIQIK